MPSEAGAPATHVETLLSLLDSCLKDSDETEVGLLIGRFSALAAVDPTTGMRKLSKRSEVDISASDAVAVVRVACSWVAAEPLTAGILPSCSESEVSTTNTSGDGLATGMLLPIIGVTRAEGWLIDGQACSRSDARSKLVVPMPSVERGARSSLPGAWPCAPACSLVFMRPYR